MLMIQESILDSDALQGYEALPEQITRIMYEVFGIMALNEELLLQRKYWMYGWNLISMDG